MDGSLLCARCEYDLRTLDVGGVCPECATPIAASVAAAADPLHAVRRQLRRACTVLLVAVVIRLTLACALVTLYVSTGRAQHMARGLAIVLSPWPFIDVLDIVWRLQRSDLLIAVLSAWFAMAFVAQCVGVWLITAPVAPAGSSAVLRHAARWTAVVTVVWGALVVSRVMRGPFKFLAYGLSTEGASIGPPLAIALWTGLLWWRTRAACGRSRSGVLVWTAIVLAALSSATAGSEPALDWMPSWLAASVAAAALLLLAVLWFDLWRLSARQRPWAARSPRAVPL